MRPAPGTRLGPYEIVESLGAGGMGVVFRARDERLQRDVAIKLLPLDALGDDSLRARFHREALALAKLSHPNIASVYDVGDHDGASYLVMECVPGQSLAERLTAGPLPVPEVISLGIDIATAMEEAHERGIIHRDLKPANVMVTPKGRAKVLDFGLAKLVARDDETRAAYTLETVGMVGTLLYMSPEQAAGGAVDARTDIWSLGVLLYELLSGTPPFNGAGTLGVLSAIAQESPRPLPSRRLAIPEKLERIVMRALEKDPARRYQTAAEMRRDLVAVSSGGAAVRGTRARRRLVAAIAAAVAISLIALGVWMRVIQGRRTWARERAIPEASALASADRNLAAWGILEHARDVLPGDTTIATALHAATQTVTVLSTPSGARVELADYPVADTGWRPLGITPLRNVRMPRGYFRWRLTLPGSAPVVLAPITRATMRFALDSLRASPPGMVFASGGRWENMVAFVGWVGPYRLPSFYIDRNEVTNRDYQRFVDAGGYEKKEYWTERFVADGRELTWADAMRRLRDSTGRAGPSTWKGGHYGDGTADYPVSGVSWYEAAAFAVWAGKSLPAMVQWYYAAPPDVASYAVRVSNIARDRVARVGAYDGVGPFGTYDMAGNVKEWAANAIAGGRRLILGGAWNSQTYVFSEPEAISPFDRASTNGFRCVRNIGAMPPAALGPIHPLERDFSKVTPASDAVFRAYKLLYAYQKGPLNAASEGTWDAPDWRKERVTVSTAYGDERMALYLFLPKRVRPPFQAVVFFPSARVMDLDDSHALGDTSFFDFVVQSGRAVVYPIYQDTYERRIRSVLPDASQGMDLTTQRFKDLGRSLDYLATRGDIDTTKLAYLGVSMGSAEGVIYTALLQDRLKTVVFLDGGYFLGKPTEGRDQADFAPRLRIPVLMVNGRYDFSFSLEHAQEPLFRMLGTAAADKRHVVLETPHDVRARRPEMMREVVGWLDKYLGPVANQAQSR